MGQLQMAGVLRRSGGGLAQSSNEQTHAARSMLLLVKRKAPFLAQIV